LILQNDNTDEDDGDPLVEKHRPALGVFESFLMALSNADKDGRVIINVDGKRFYFITVVILLILEKNPNRSSLKFLLLNPEAHFTEILEQARAVILAGGTMQPVRFVQQITYTTL
jgi:chromosome transmission fidelity protein 1